MDGKHLNVVQKVFIEVMEEPETNSTHPCNPSQLIVRVFDAINYNHSGILPQQALGKENEFLQSGFQRRCTNSRQYPYCRSEPIIDLLWPAFIGAEVSYLNEIITTLLQNMSVKIKGSRT